MVRRIYKALVVMDANDLRDLIIARNHWGAADVDVELFSPNTNTWITSNINNLPPQAPASAATVGVLFGYAYRVVSKAPINRSQAWKDEVDSAALVTLSCLLWYENPRVQESYTLKRWVGHDGWVVSNVNWKSMLRSCRNYTEFHNDLVSQCERYAVYQVLSTYNEMLSAFYEHRRMYGTLPPCFGVCSGCGRNNVPTRSLQLHGGMLLCRECHRKAHTCRHCHMYISNHTDMIRGVYNVASNEEGVCVNCARTLGYWTCQHCQYVHPADTHAVHPIDAPSRSYCTSCVLICLNQCHNCEGWFTASDTFRMRRNETQDEVQICTGCMTTEYDDTPDCLRCGIVFVPGDGEEYCYHCEEGITECGRCGRDVHRDDMYTTESNPRTSMCNTCYNAIAVSCPSCGRTCSTEEDDCYNCGYDLHRPTVREYSYRPPQFFMLGEDEEFRMGVELEMDSGCTSDFLDCIDEEHGYDSQYYLKEDGSLGEDGVEIVTHPATLKHHKKHMPWRYVLTQAKGCGFLSFNAGDRCGCHIHLPRKFFSETEQIKLGLMIYTCASKFSVIAQRGNTTYTKFKKWKAKKNVHKEDRDRYSAVNYLNTHTIELRLFKGTLARGSLLSYIETAHAVSHFIKTVSVQEILSGERKIWDRFVAYVYDNHEIYNNLIAYMERKHIAGVHTGKKPKHSQVNEIIEDNTVA